MSASAIIKIIHFEKKILKNNINNDEIGIQ